METKKLTCCDLMIGDLVRFDMSVSHNNPEGDGKWINCIVGGIGGLAFGGTTRFIYLYDVKRKSKIGEFDFVRSLDELSPIPLTAEILEKNGLKNYEEYPEYKIKTNEYEIWVIFDESQNCIHIEKYDKSIPTIYHSKILYVHELQHAMRLAGINDKEIVL